MHFSESGVGCNTVGNMKQMCNYILLINRIWNDVTTDNYKQLGTDYLKMVLKLAGSMGSGDNEGKQQFNTSQTMSDTIAFTMVHVSTLKRYINEVSNVTSYSRVENRRSPL